MMDPGGLLKAVVPARFHKGGLYHEFPPAYLTHSIPFSAAVMVYNMVYKEELTMTEMLRKQIYISLRQQALLKRLSKERGISESEIIRQAIDREAGKIPSGAFESTRRRAWEDAYAFMRSIQAKGALKDQRRNWNREDLYDERLRRYDRDPD
jgi:hypothetical protein